MTTELRLSAIHKQIEVTLSPFTMMLTTRKLSRVKLLNVAHELEQGAREIRMFLEEKE